MKLTLNPYALVIDRKGTFHFILSDHTNPVKLVPNEDQKSLLEKLHRGEFIAYSELCTTFPTKVMDALMQNGCLVPFEVDTQSASSRTNAFFLTHHMPEARERLNKKKVLILGCGGIGTHMAWHMAALGIAKLTIVDFDTVETSNFNRQILFDHADIGNLKVDVLKKKLAAINENIQIETLCARISSEEELERICMADNYDLIIKALDSPAEFPFWLDKISRKHNLTYLSGITMRENILIGPSFISGKSSYGWSELMPLELEENKKVYGTAPSLGIMLYHIASELAVEAFKILTGYGKIKYMDKILCKNLLTEEEHYFQKNTAVQDANQSKIHESTGKSLFLSILLMVSLSIAGIWIHWFMPIAFMMAMALPFLLYQSNQDVVRCTFLNATIFSLAMLVLISRSFDMSTAASLISSLVLLFGIHSTVTLFMCVINYFIYTFRHLDFFNFRYPDM